MKDRTVKERELTQFMPDGTPVGCDYVGDECSNHAVAERWDSNEHDWIPVCSTHSLRPPQKRGNK